MTMGRNLREISSAKGSVPGIESQERRARELRGRGNQNQIIRADQPDDGWAERLVAASEHETLRSDGTENEPALAMTGEEFEDLLLG
jgi:hypothetical protein